MASAQEQMKPYNKLAHKEKGAIISLQRASVHVVSI